MTTTAITALRMIDDTNNSPKLKGSIQKVTVHEQITQSSTGTTNTKITTYECVQWEQSQTKHPVPAPKSQPKESEYGGIAERLWATAH